MASEQALSPLTGEVEDHVLTRLDDPEHPPQVKDIRYRDLKRALSLGIDDFMAHPTHVMFLCILYPIVGLILSRLIFGYQIVPLLFPLMAGFTLMGPILAIGLYEMSRRREKGLEAGWKHVFDVLKSPSIGGIGVLTGILTVIFVGWLAIAQKVYEASFGAGVPDGFFPFLEAIFTTPAGWQVILVGCGIGFFFACTVLTISVVAMPMLLHRNVGVAKAIQVSIKATFANWMCMSTWGLLVTGGMILGSLPFFMGLAIVMPILGHSTWHLYRRVITY